MNNESGFTLIEIIVSLVLVGMMAAIAGMGIVTGTRGYLLAKENSHMAQKAQLAMARIQRELMELTDIAARRSDPAFIIYDNTSGRHAIAIDGTTINMFLNLGPTQTTLPGWDQSDILVDNVHNFNLFYYEGSNPWGGVDINLLSAIRVDLVLGRSDGSGDTVTFSTTVNPRNTNNYGGAPPTTIPPTAYNYSCFVSTAAYNNASHPTVLLLSLLIFSFVFFFLPLRHKDGKDRKLEGLEVWKLKNLSASRPHSLQASKPHSFPASQPPSLPASLLRQNKGNVLIGLIVTMMIFAALGAGMVAMTGTSTSNQVTANTTSKAYYLAESGFRYAASVYLNTGDTDNDGEIEDDRNQALVDLHNTPTFTLSNPDEQFSLEVYPYYFVTTGSHVQGSTSLQITFAGNIPDDFSMPSTGRLRIGSGIYNYTGYSDLPGTFTLQAPGLLEAISDNMNVNPVGNPAGGIMRNGEDLTLADASFFPMITGKFTIDGIAYTYKTKTGNILENITDANNPNRVFSFSVDSNTNVVLRPYLKIHSTGTVGQDDLAASRQIFYNVPIPDSPTEAEKVEFHDQFDDKSHWEATSTWGDHTVQNVGGDSALMVTDTQSFPGGIEASLIGFEWSSTNVNLQYAQSVSGYFLSYDAQVKVGFEPTVPDDYAAGLSFRLDGNNNSYGVSFMRADDSGFGSAVDPDIVPKINVNEPLYDIPMIVLWQQINSGEDRQYLAYTFGTNEFSDDMENPLPPPGWTAEGTWARVQPGGPLPSGTWCWANDLFGAPGTVESLITPAMDLSDAPSAVLTFWHKINFNDPGDIGSVIVDGSTVESFSSSDPQDIWRQEAMIIPVGNIQVEFRIETDDGSVCDWHIDDVTIHRGFPVNESTLLVRIKEAAEVRFTSGGTTPVEDGDIITQANGAYGTVIGEPILSGGDWASGNAVGIITLNKVSETNFQSGQALDVAGKGTNLATCQGYTDRYNYIKVFYSDINGYGIPNTDPFDAERRENSRNTVHWPPDEIQDWSAERDYFTLVQWDGVNAVDLVESVDEPGVIVLGTESTLFTPVSGLPLIRPELGLHTFGSVINNAYFDDFGLQVEIAPGSGFLTPIQE